MIFPEIENSDSSTFIGVRRSGHSDHRTAMWAPQLITTVSPCRLTSGNTETRKSAKLTAGSGSDFTLSETATPKQLARAGNNAQGSPYREQSFWGDCDISTRPSSDPEPIRTPGSLLPVVSCSELHLLLSIHALVLLLCHFLLIFPPQYVAVLTFTASLLSIPHFCSRKR